MAFEEEKVQIEKGKTSKFRRRLQKEVHELQSLEFWRAGLAEILGTGFLVLFGICAGLSPSNLSADLRPNAVTISLQAGLYIAVVVATLWNISGGHVNPAISVGFLLTGNITCVRFILYVTAQLIGAVVGASLAKAMTSSDLQLGNFGVIEPGEGIEDYQAVLGEFFITFILMFGVFSFLDPGRKDHQGALPLMIGVIVIVNIFATWHISGGCMNPARNFGPAVITGNFTYQWIYWVGPMLGASAGALCYEWVFSSHVCKKWRAGECLDKQADDDDSEGIEDYPDENGDVNEKTALNLELQKSAK